MGEKRDVTRRTLLSGAAAAGAASLIGPATGLARAFDAPELISNRWIGALRGETRPLTSPGRFVLIGIEWTAPAGAVVELRTRRQSGRWSPWVPASVLGHEPDGSAPGGALFGEPLWTGPADAFQVRADRAVTGLRVHFVGAAPPRARAAASSAFAQPVLAAGPGQPAIRSRQAWAAGQARPRHAPTYGAVDLAFVHHTVNPNGYGAAAVPAMLLAIFQYHVFVRGFWDIAYNFIIDLYGRIWEGRAGGIDMAVIGAHAGAYNAQSTGIAVLGDFMNVVPSRAALGALQHLLAWKLSLHGLPAQGRVTVVVDPPSASYTPFRPGAHVSLPRIAGHRDGDATDCPGNAFYARLPAIRPRVASLAGTPARLTVSAPSLVVSAGTPLTLSGNLASLAGPPLAGAPVELQRLRLNGLTARAVTVATVTTAPDGSWSSPLTLSSNALLRGLHRPGPAAVSDWAAVAVAPAITLSAESTAPLQVTGTVAPAKRRVAVDLYQPGRTTGKPIASRTVPVSHGRFAAALRAPRPGDYVLVARTAADALNAAGASPPVAVTVA
jgi:N-acetylmuramoyl-L-alanine amidase